MRALVLRFGADCVLVWSNDKNFITFLSDHATATRLIDHNSTSPGAVMVLEALGMSAQASLMVVFFISPSPPFSSPPPLFLSPPSPSPLFPSSYQSGTRRPPPPPPPLFFLPPLFLSLPSPPPFLSRDF
ncbi:hypothetical protein KSP40_PGU017384 [Platanthera guangdongensis]|uniref:NFXL1 RRM-like domain-containing protein n=1 Tax=Platanthera guangdongensis TaxID=2320717 RepID=A0ABR2M634_9ASPA